MELSADAKGYFRKPFTLDLLDTSALTTKPDVAFEIGLPNFGDLRNLGFKDVIKLLQQAMEFLVGDNEGDTVETCSGGLLGKELFGTNLFVKKIPVVGVSACDSAGYLKVVVDAVNTLVNECLECDGDDSEENSSTFQALEKKLEALLQGKFYTVVNYCRHENWYLLTNYWEFPF